MGDAIRNVLSGEDPTGVTLTARAVGALAEIRTSFAWVRPGRTAVVTDEKGATWWTFAGLHANASLMGAMGPLVGASKVENLAIRLKPERGDAEAVRAFAEGVDRERLPLPSIARDLARKLKFADCLPEHIAVDVAGARVRDLAGVRRVVAEPVDSVRTS